MSTITNHNVKTRCPMPSGYRLRSFSDDAERTTYGWISFDGVVTNGYPSPESAAAGARCDFQAHMNVQRMSA
ncbi:hypothetical protein VRRI112168_02275 [Vreelandella rituensis]|uniref:Uncharacterized protein n=1 Tax=Vreelandella rituensis TaxID=2282306 RepID=A0A368U9F5_9GAMM|nr:hypothetical protein [Halomonas rituensis]RCV93575.1 hypothetical protein DU506_00020 [Halomonas rituensis]